MKRKFMIELLRIAVVLASGVAGLATWYMVLTPSAATLSVLFLAVVAAVGMTYWRDGFVADAAYDEAYREVPRPVREQHQPRPPRRAMPEETIHLHDSLAHSVKHAVEVLEDAKRLSEEAVRSLEAVDAQMVALQDENARLSEEVTKIDAIGTILSGGPVPREVPAEVRKFAPSRDVRAVPREDDEHVPQFLTSNHVDLDRLQEAVVSIVRANPQEKLT